MGFRELSGKCWRGADSFTEELSSRSYAGRINYKTAKCRGGFPGDGARIPEAGSRSPEHEARGTVGA